MVDVEIKRSLRVRKSDVKVTHSATLVEAVESSEAMGLFDQKDAHRDIPRSNSRFAKERDGGSSVSP